jgi:Ca2+-binding EF-hand superfamily protein
VKEAFKVYDPQGTGFVDHETLRSIFENLGYGEITDEDLAVLVETADADGDGRISLDDFRGMLSMSKERLQGDAAAAAPP